MPPPGPACVLQEYGFLFSNHTIGTNGPSELPCTQRDHIKNNLGTLNEMHLTNRTIGMIAFSIGTNCTIGTNGPSELPCTQLDHMEKQLIIQVP